LFVRIPLTATCFVQSVHVTTKGARSNPVNGDVYSIKLLSDTFGQ